MKKYVTKIIFNIDNKPKYCLGYVLNYKQLWDEVSKEEYYNQELPIFQIK